MVKKIEYWECEICGNRFDSEENAKDCEARGVPDISRYPQGMLVGDHSGGLYKDITFAVCKVNVHKHYFSFVYWACRENKAGDSLGENLCGSGSYVDPDRINNNLNIKHPTYIRMIKWLQSQNIPITVWDGFKAIPLDDWLKSQAGVTWMNQL